MKFWKMHGAGNDFVLLDDRERALDDTRLPALAKAVCARRFSLGADGLMVIRPAEGEGDFKLLFYNSDGSLGEMCGNGARCVCRWGCETGLSGETQRVETTAGLVTGRRVGERVWRVRLNDPGVVDLDRAVEIDGETYVCAYIELGVPGSPHAVLPWEDLQNAPPDALRPLARRLRAHPAFPKGANVTFYEILGPGRLFLRTFERGVEDFTNACGTGTGSTVLALTLKGLLPPPGGADALMAGGTLRVDVDMEAGRVKDLWLTGPAELVAVGELTDEALAL